MLVTVEDIQKHLTILKITVKGKGASKYNDDEIHMAVDRSESLVSAMIAVALDSQLLHPFLILKESAVK
ncbi:MAG: hypothetical protein EZS28_020391 [Streblomastix strix]|uniref:Uncharacterized protein n=1 Tax=Streblomastix strix TaxID=222440 RepID=A0A5J4VNH1_9EUKA|nr:MAG: hypothetical protein EZS28_020391 [Streblomastix strix]